MSIDFLIEDFSLSIRIINCETGERGQNSLWLLCMFRVNIPFSNGQFKYGIEMGSLSNTSHR